MKKEITKWFTAEEGIIILYGFRCTAASLPLVATNIAAELIFIVCSATHNVINTAM